MTVQRQATAGGTLIHKIIWTAGTFGASILLKLGSNVILSRLLAPEVFGIMVIINSMRLFVELLSDIGIEQNIVSHRDGLKIEFFNTAWTIQIMRGAILTGVFLLISPFLASFYKIDLGYFLVISFAPFLNGCSSTSIFAMVKNLEVRKRNMFELRSEFLSFLFAVVLVLISPTVWSVVLGALLGVAARSVLSYFIDHPPHKIMLVKGYAWEIWDFGKWIMISSLVMYAATNLDRLYLGRVAPFYLLGIYGIARTIADLPASLSRRLSYQVVFPALAATKENNDSSAMAELNSTRLKFVLLAAVAVAIGVSFADFAIKLLYDPRYDEAGWMLSVLLVGAWFSILSTLNEAFVLGAGRPGFNSATNALRFLVLAATLPLGFTLMGFPGAVIAMVLTELFRYAFVAVGQYKVKMTFWRQDAIATVVGLVLVLLLLAARIELGFSTPWGLMSLPH